MRARGPVGPAPWGLHAPILPIRWTGRTARGCGRFDGPGGRIPSVDRRGWPCAAVSPGVRGRLAGGDVPTGGWGGRRVPGRAWQDLEASRASAGAVRARPAGGTHRPDPRGSRWTGPAPPTGPGSAASFTRARPARGTTTDKGFSPPPLLLLLRHDVLARARRLPSYECAPQGGRRRIRVSLLPATTPPPPPVTTCLPVPGGFLHTSAPRKGDDDG